MSAIEIPVYTDETVSTSLSQSRAHFTGGELIDASGDEISTAGDPATGPEPDPRFTLANERTLLAWNRTSLALIGGGIAVDHLIDFPLVAGRLLASLTPVVLGALLAIVSLRRWLATERALRTGAPLPKSQTVLVLVIGICVVAAAIVLSIVLDAITG